MKATTTPHPIYFLAVRTKGQDRTSLKAIKDERTGERFACLFVSAQDAEEFAVANELPLDVYRISEARDPASIQSCCGEVLRGGIYEFVINPPPAVRGVWRTLFVEQLRTWSRKAKNPLLVWAGYEVLPKEVGKYARKRANVKEVVKHARGVPYGLCGIPETLEACEEERVRAAERPPNEELSKFLDEVRGEIIDQAEKQLARWVAMKDQGTSSRR